MPIIMKKKYTIAGNYTPEQLVILQEFIDNFRVHMADDDPQKNILTGKIAYYTDNTILSLLKQALDDINGGYPRTSYTFFNFQSMLDDTTILNGAIIFAMMREGVLQLRNQIEYSDSGLSIAMFNKTQAYQSWAGFLLADYMNDKQQFKASIIPKSENSGFYGIGSEFSYRGGNRW